jgi:hypothetical protein
MISGYKNNFVKRMNRLKLSASARGRFYTFLESPYCFQRVSAVGKSDGAGHVSEMTAADLKNLLERIQTWPEEAQNEPVAVAAQIESELQGDEYTAAQNELQVIDEAMASLDAGEFATDSEVAVRSMG